MSRETEVFAKKFRATRDRGLTPQESWNKRHTAPFIVYTFSICSIKPLSKYRTEDLMWALLEAATKTETTEVQIYFGMSSCGNVTARINGLLRALMTHGFTPMHAYRKMGNDGKGWISLPLFSKNDIPVSSDKPMFFA